MSLHHVMAHCGRGEAREQGGAAAYYVKLAESSTTYRESQDSVSLHHNDINIAYILKTKKYDE